MQTVVRDQGVNSVISKLLSALSHGGKYGVYRLRVAVMMTNQGWSRWLASWLYGITVYTVILLYYGLL